MKATYLLFLTFFILLISSQKTKAQNKKLTISSNKEINSVILDSITFNKNHHSINDISTELIKISKKLTKKGFINNTYTISNKDSIFHSVFTLNKKIDSIRILYSNSQLDNIILNKISDKFTTTYFEIATNHIELTLSKIITYFEHNGSTFTTCKLNNIILNKNKLVATLNLHVSKKRNINNIVIKGYEQFPKKFLKHHLNLVTNKSFNLDIIKRINSQLKTIPFITQIKESEILFTKDSTTLYLYLKKQNKNNFNGIIGFSNKKGSSKLQLNGNLNINLNNALNKGESFSFHWRNDGNNSQKLNLNLSTPFLFNTPISGSSNFSILKQDSIYNTTSLLLALKYKFKGNNYLGLNLNTENSSTNVISTPLNKILPYQKYFCGLNFKHNSQTLDHTFTNPKFQFTFGFDFGNRMSSKTLTSQQQLLLSTHYNFSLGTKSSIFIKNSNKLLISNTPITNELYRIGGANSLRGFDEQSIFTSKYSITNLEYHFKLTQDSHLLTITDLGFIYNNSERTTDQLYGVGFGYLSTINNNKIQLSYIVGNNTLTPFLLNNSKIHIKFNYTF